jgi:hypothetical protein
MGQEKLRIKAQNLGIIVNRSMGVGDREVIVYAGINTKSKLKKRHLS